MTSADSHVGLLAVKAVPAGYVLLNLASMYEMISSMPAKEAKAGLAAWAHSVAGDDFDMACLRLDDDKRR